MDTIEKIKKIVNRGKVVITCMDENPKRIWVSFSLDEDAWWDYSVGHSIEEAVEDIFSRLKKNKVI